LRIKEQETHLNLHEHDDDDDDDDKSYKKRVDVERMHLTQYSKKTGIVRIM